MKYIGLVGQGGHAKVIRDMIQAQGQYKIKAVFDDCYDCLCWREDMYYGPVSSVQEVWKQLDFQVVIAIGSNVVRKRIVDDLRLPDWYYATVIHPTAVISSSSSIGAGTVVMPYAVVNADAIVGRHVIVNTGAIVEHDSVIENYVHLSPHATLTGTVTVGEGTQIGAGAVVIPNTTVGQWSTVGAGSTIIHNVPSYCTAVGSPARVIHNKE